MQKIFSTFVLTLAILTANAAVPALNEFPAFTFEGNSALRSPAAKQASPVELKEYKQSTYDCAYFDWWYFGYSENSYFGYVLFDTNGNEIAFTVLSQSETDYVTYLDGVAFKDEYEDRDVESHHYISTYWILNSLNGVRWGGNDGNQEVVANCVKEVSGGTTSYLALRTGTYWFYVYEVNYAYDDYGNITGVQTGGYNRVKFTISGDEVRDLKAVVATDKKTATISWTKPSLPADAHLYLNVQSGEQVAYDNYSSKTSPENPLTIEVEEGRTYCVTALYMTSRKNALGSEQIIYFTVGTNAYLPTNAKAVVAEDDVVEFSWSATKQAESYELTVYQGHQTFAQYKVSATSLTKQIPTGTYTWQVVAYEKGTDGLYYPITEPVKGNSFSTKTAPLPEGTEELNVWGMEAFLMEDYVVNNQYPWLISFETGDAGGSGLPEVWIIVWANRELALSGNYSGALGNVELSATAGEGSLLNTTGADAGLVTATDVTLRMEFDGFDMDYGQLGYYIPYYSGEFFMDCANGRKLHGVFNQLICGTYPYSQLTTSTSSRTIIDMLGEAVEGIEDVQTDNALGTKVLRNGQIIIRRAGVEYNVLGTRVK